MVASTLFNSRALRRYAELEPRHCLYPEVPNLYTGFDERQYRAHARRSNAELIPRPISMYVRVPEDVGTGEHYVEQLLREIELVAPLFDHDRDVVRLRFGGAADRLAPAPLARLLDSVARRFHVVGPGHRDYCIELDPAAADAGRIAACRSAGAREVDSTLTFGLGPQTLAQFASVLQALIDARPDRIGVRDGALTLQRGLAPVALDATTRLAMLEHAIDVLTAAGYRHAGEDRFDLVASDDGPGKCDQVGLGAGAISRFGDGVSENLADARRWQAALDARHLPLARGISLSFDDRLRAEVLRRLLHSGEVDADEIEQQFIVAFDARFAQALDGLRQLEGDGLVRIVSRHIAATSRGRYLWRILAACFDPDPELGQHGTSNAESRVEENQRGTAAQ